MSRLRISMVVLLLGLVPIAANAGGVEGWSCDDFMKLSEDARRGVTLGYAMGWVGAAEMTSELGASLEQDDVRRTGQAVQQIARGISSDAIYERVAARCLARDLERHPGSRLGRRC